MNPEERILTGLWLCAEQPNEILAELKPEWNASTKESLIQKLKILGNEFSIKEVFPWTDQLSECIEHKDFLISHIRQPDLFLRLRPGFEQLVKRKLSAAGISFSTPISNCLALPNSTKLDEIIELDKEAVIQDLNSQRIAEFLPDFFSNVWDCCAASGGKSILAFDLNPSINLTVSDLRESILANLKRRFKKAGIQNYRSLQSDLTITDFRHPSSDFDLLICDAPCTGSGTWSRTPEQLFYFEVSKIEYYQQLQRSILQNVISNIKMGGHLLYCTCSVFRKENEENKDWLSNEFGLTIVRSEILKGYYKRADSLFATLMRRE